MPPKRTPLYNPKKKKRGEPGGKPSEKGRPTQMELAFLEEYLVDADQAQAFRRAWQFLHDGVDPPNQHTWYQNGRRLVQKPWMQKKLAERHKSLADKLGITQERILREMAALAFCNMEDYIKVDEEGNASVDLTQLNRDHAAAISHLTTKTYYDKGVGERVTETSIKLSPKKEALDTLGRHVGVKGFGTGKLEITGEDGGPLKVESIANLPDSQLEAIVKAAEAAAQRKKDNNN